MLYFCYVNEYFLLSMVSWGDLAIKKNVGGLIKDESCIIAKSLLGWVASQEQEENTFLCVEVMWSESSRSEPVQEFHGKSCGISRIAYTVSTGSIVASPSNSSCEMMALIRSIELFNELFFEVNIVLSAIKWSTVALEHGRLHLCREISSPECALAIPWWQCRFHLVFRRDILVECK